MSKKFRCVMVCVSASLVRVGAQLGLTHMITIEIKIPNRMVGLGKQRWDSLFLFLLSTYLPYMYFKITCAPFYRQLLAEEAK